MKKFLVGLLSAVSILCIVFACNTSVVRAVESSCINNVNVIPTNTNEKYAKYIKDLEIGRASVSEVMSAFEAMRVTKGAETEASLTAEAELANQPFDFEIWHEEAMEIFNRFDSLFRSIEGDSTWAQCFQIIQITRAGYKETYLSNVGDATADKWASFTDPEIGIYYNTYLAFIRFMSGRGQDDYQKAFHSNEIQEEDFFLGITDVATWTGTHGEEIEELYRELVKYQVAYFDEYGMPYNFINDKSYAEEMGLSEEESLPNTEEKAADFTADELNEIREVIEEEESESGDSGVFKGVIIIIVLLAIAGGGYLVINNKKKSKSTDN